MTVHTDTWKSVLSSLSSKIKKTDLVNKSTNYIEKIDSQYLDNKFFISSSTTKSGRQDILNFIMQ